MSTNQLRRFLIIPNKVLRRFSGDKLTQNFTTIERWANTLPLPIYEVGQASITANPTTINFKTPFFAPPSVTATPSNSHAPFQITGSTTTGFTAQFYDGTTYTAGAFSWIAVL